jgi:hypothetical protein
MFSHHFTTSRTISLYATCRLQNNKILRIVPLEFSAKKLRGSFTRFKNAPKVKKTKNSQHVLLLSQDKSVGLLTTAAKPLNTGNFRFRSTE